MSKKKHKLYRVYLLHSFDVVCFAVVFYFCCHYSLSLSLLLLLSLLTYEMLSIPLPLSRSLFLP